MPRSPLTVTQGFIQRMLKAAKNAEYDVLRVEGDPKTGKVVLVVKEGGNEKRVEVNPFDTAPTPWSARKGRK